MYHKERFNKYRSRYYNLYGGSQLLREEFITNQDNRHYVSKIYPVFYGKFSQLNEALFQLNNKLFFIINNITVVGVDGKVTTLDNLGLRVVGQTDQSGYTVPILELIGETKNEADEFVRQATDRSRKLQESDKAERQRLSQIRDSARKDVEGEAQLIFEHVKKTYDIIGDILEKNKAIIVDYIVQNELDIRTSSRKVNDLEFEIVRDRYKLEIPLFKLSNVYEVSYVKVPNDTKLYFPLEKSTYQYSYWDDSDTIDESEETDDSETKKALSIFDELINSPSPVDDNVNEALHKNKKYIINKLIENISHDKKRFAIQFDFVPINNEPRNGGYHYYNYYKYAIIYNELYLKEKSYIVGAIDLLSMTNRERSNFDNIHDYYSISYSKYVRFDGTGEFKLYTDTMRLDDTYYNNLYRIYIKERQKSEYGRYK